MTWIGSPVKRREDQHLLTGQGEFVTNLVPEGAAHVAYVLSHVPHARLVSVDATEARSAPGVLGVYAVDDLDDTVMDEYPQQFPGMNPEMRRPILARDVVRFVGEPIVAVVAETPAQARDAVELVVVDYEPIEGGSLFPGISDPLAFATEVGEPFDDLDGAEVVVRARILNPRMSAAPMEPRAGWARWVDGRLEHWSASQAVFENKAFLAAFYKLAPDQVRVLSPDVGGSFGAKFRAYPEEALLGWLSRQVERPVAWLETRTESMLGLGQGRGQVQDVTVAGRRDGTIEAYDLHVVQDSGAYPLIAGFLPRMTQLMAPGCYAIPRVHYSAESIATPTTPNGAYRGAGRPEATAAIERAVDLFADEVGLDPAEVRRRNFIPADAFPFTTAVGTTYDSGDYARALDLVLDAAGYADLRAEQERRRSSGETPWLGLGLASYVEVTGSTKGPETGTVHLQPDGTFVAFAGSTPHGQGHDTTWAQVIADQLDVDMDRISVVMADTDRVAQGMVTGGSRSVQQVGARLHDASRVLVERAKQAAAERLEAAADDVVMSEGRFHVAGTPARAVEWAELGPLDGESEWQPDQASFPFGTHLAVVEVDPDTGGVTLIRLIGADDAGTIVNPLLFDGQVHGGMGGGVAQALLEEVQFDDDGTPMTTNFADYLVISATELPSFELVRSETPSPHNPLGAKGIGEAGSIGATAAVHNAVVDAVSHLGIRHIDMPLAPEKVWRAIQQA